jgi:amino acid transporter
MTEAPSGIRGLKRSLKLGDLILLNIVAVYTPGTISQVLPMGRGGLLLWTAGLLTFMLPYALAIADLSARHPREGGVYAWTRMAFGDFHGFFCGWCYWVNTFLYVPSVFVSIAAVAALLGGPRTAWINDSPAMVMLIACGALWISALLHIVGLGQGKWIQNLGACGRLAIVVVIIGAALWKLVAHPAMSEPGQAPLGFWPVLALWPFVLNAMVGLDLGAAMSEEADRPGTNIPRSLLTGGLAVGVCYLLTYGAVVFLGADNPDPIYGHVQAVNSLFAAAGAGWLAPVAIILELAGLIGIGAAWLAAPARVPFAIGIDRYLPSAFARVHPRFGTPYVALIVQAAIATGLILIYNYNARLKDAYLALLGSSIVLVMLTYVYLLAAWIKLSRPGLRVKLLGGVCIAASALAVAAGFLPPPSVTDPLMFEIKLAGSVAVMLALGLILYVAGSRASASGVASLQPGSLLER